MLFTATAQVAVPLMADSLVGGWRMPGSLVYGLHITYRERGVYMEPVKSYAPSIPRVYYFPADARGVLADEGKEIYRPGGRAGIRLLQADTLEVDFCLPPDPPCKERYVRIR